jgi:hypothetical protein
MYLLHCQSRKKVKAEIVLISEDELTEIMSEGRFEFDWEQEILYEIYAVRIIKTDEVVGLVALDEVKDESRVEIKLIENSRENRGRSKIYDRIAGCLIGWACYQAYIRGYEGFISLLPKTRLIQHYQNAYGFEQNGRHLALYGKQSHHLIEKYLYNVQS